MQFTAEKAVAQGAAWLDATYPGWIDSIDLAALNLSDCQTCIMGQVWHGHIPAEERTELFAQILDAATPNVYDRDVNNGFVALQALNGFVPGRSNDTMAKMGFFAVSCNITTHEHLRVFDEWGYATCGCVPTYAQLLDAWTLLILRRRIAAHPDLAELGSDIYEIEKEKVAV